MKRMYETYLELLMEKFNRNEEVRILINNLDVEDGKFDLEFYQGFNKFPPHQELLEEELSQDFLDDSKLLGKSDVDIKYERYKLAEKEALKVKNHVEEILKEEGFRVL